MRSDDIFSFGKYKGLLIKDVYLGYENIESDFVKEMFWHRLLLLTISIYGASSIVEMKNFLQGELQFEISNRVIKIKANSESNTIQWNKIISALQGKRELFDLLMSRYYSDQDVSRKPTSNGNPYYIFWCIRNLEDFYINPPEIEILENLQVVFFESIEFNFTKSNLFEYKAHFSKRNHKFPLYEKKLNQEKFSSSGNF